MQLISFKDDAIWKKSDGEVKVAYMVLEFVNGGELFEFIAISPFTPSICRYYFKQMLQAIYHAQEKGLAHRDLKPENIMLDKEFNVKVADFGFAAPTAGRDGSGYLHTKLGTLAYMAPEIIQEQPYSGASVDLFALGIILFILYTGHPPFNQANPTDSHYKLIVTNRADLFWKYHSKSHPENFFSEEFKDLITNMLQYNPNQRLNLVDIIGHPWMAQDVAEHSEITAEFTHRHQQIKAHQEAEAAQKQMQKSAIKVHRGVNEQGKTFLSLCDKEDQADDNTEYEESKDNDFIGKTMDPFVAETFNAKFKSTAIFSTHKPETIIAQLSDALYNMSINYELNDKKWKMVFENTKRPEATEADDKAKPTEGKDIKFLEGCRVSAKLLRVDEERICLDFSRVTGSSWHFYEVIKELKKQLKDIHDSTY